MAHMNVLASKWLFKSECLQNLQWICSQKCRSASDLAIEWGSSLIVQLTVSTSKPHNLQEACHDKCKHGISCIFLTDFFFQLPQQKPQTVRMKSSFLVPSCPQKWFATFLNFLLWYLCISGRPFVSYSDCFKVIQLQQDFGWSQNVWIISSGVLFYMIWSSGKFMFLVLYTCARE